jgi:hypothetical protein
MAREACELDGPGTRPALASQSSPSTVVVQVHTPCADRTPSALRPEGEDAYRVGRRDVVM